MSSDFEGYEQDFAVLTAEITSKISRVPRLPPGENLALPGGGVLGSREAGAVGELGATGDSQSQDCRGRG